MIAILTGSNDNVFTRLGLALGNNRPVIVVTTNADALPSMIRHFNAILYDSSVPDWKQLHASLAKSCQDLARAYGASPLQNTQRNSNSPKN